MRNTERAAKLLTDAIGFFNKALRSTTPTSTDK